MKKRSKLLAITPGEPAGIGPDIVLKLATQGRLTHCVVIADPTLLAQRAEQLKLHVSIQCIEPSQACETSAHHSLTVLPIALKSPCITGKLNASNASYVIETLQYAALGCLKKDFFGIITGPVHKGIINEAGIPFKGHTEFFAAISGVPSVVMMLICDEMRVALATTHLPLAQVSSAITPTLIEQTLRILRAELIEKFNLKQPKILICGLNPHAGEGGHLGKEEIQILIPVIEQLQSEGFHLEGPLSADTIFTPKYLQKADAILAMYHDQGLPVIKYAAFGQAVNVTLGLPFIRASVDHGTALELAGTGKADIMSFKAAIDWARQLESSHPA
jgi:4-hydroxythreonine-4-phosphate dehydrogenase